MEKILIEFINTLDISLKKVQAETGDLAGFSRLTINQLQYIEAIHELEAPALSEIADRLNITRPSVSIGINKLIEMGYVTKTQSKEDRRVFHASLTQAGEDLVRAKFESLKKYGEFIRLALSQDEARQFEETLTKIVQLFKQND